MGQPGSGQEAKIMTRVPALTPAEHAEQGTTVNDTGPSMSIN